MGSASWIHWIIIITVMLLTLAVSVIPPWIIVRKAGYHPALSLLGLIPGVGIIMIWVFALSDWPALRRDDA